VAIQWVRLGIFKVEKMNQKGHFHQKKKNNNLVFILGSALIFKGRTTRNKPFLLLGLSAMSIQCPVVCGILPSARACQNNLTTARGGAALPSISAKICYAIEILDVTIVDNINDK
jgi:hypothetical protein